MEDGGKRKKKKHGFSYKRVCILKEPHFAKFSQESEEKKTLLCTSTVEMKKKKKNLFAFLTFKAVEV
jgi:predicted NAD-dependent protein-ADP-ribosyltransferase YbiA (DUF1768 family)